MTSVARNVHIPSLVESSCCCKSSKCDSRAGSACTCATALDTRALLNLVFVRVFVDDRGLFEVVGRWGRGGLPLEPGGTPGIRAGDRAVFERDQEVDQRQEIADGEDRRS